MEKKRRARINESLQELRVLMADADVSRDTVQVFQGNALRDFVLLLKQKFSPACVAGARYLRFLSPAAVAIKDGECRSAGDDSETCGGLPAKPGSRYSFSVRVYLRVRHETTARCVFPPFGHTLKQT